MVLWFIGLSGSGKTTLGREVYQRIRSRVSNIVFLDGDVLREVFGHDVDHTVEGRRKNAERISRLSKMLSNQGLHVIAAVLSIFPEWQSWNRQNLNHYAEVYLKVNMDTLKARDPKGLYARAYAGKEKNVVGVDIPFPEPLEPTLTIDNNAHLEDMESLIQQVLGLPQIKAIKSLL